MHGAIGGAPARVLTRPVYGSIRGVTRLVGASIDYALAQLTPLLGESGPDNGDAVLAALNGVLGDYLEEKKNPLAIAMELRRGESTGDGRNIVVLVHGSSMSDKQWLREGHDHGVALARDLGVVPVYVRYNTGLHVSVNGRALAAKLEAFVRESPVEIETITLLGHSMGGLVARSALHYGSEAHHTWRARTHKLICVGSPHHGAPLERAGSIVDLLLGISRYSAPFKKLGRIRSAGVTDLRFGSVLDEHWTGRDRFARGRDPRKSLALPDGVASYAIAGKLKRGGDGLVPLDSALGKHAKTALTLAFPEEHQWIAVGAGHLELLGRQDVYDVVRKWMER